MNAAQSAPSQKSSSSTLVQTFPWFLLPARLLLFAGFQAVIAIIYLLRGTEDSWTESAAWWPITVALTNFVCLGLLVRIFRLEGKNYWSIFRVVRKSIKSDLLVMLGLLVITGPVAFLPNLLLGNALFGDQMAAMELFLRPLPLWGTILAIALFPITQGMVELPFYFLYILPRLEAQTRKLWLALALSALMLGIQHLAVPLLYDARFILWRGLMFIPFAFLAGAALRWRPRLMPYMALVHVVMDFATAVMLLGR